MSIEETAGSFEVYLHPQNRHVAILRIAEESCPCPKAPEGLPPVWWYELADEEEVSGYYLVQRFLFVDLETQAEALAAAARRAFSIVESEPVAPPPEPGICSEET